MNVRTADWARLNLLESIAFRQSKGGGTMLTECTLVWIGSDGQTDVDYTKQFNEDTAKLREYFLAKGLPAVVAETMAEYEWDDDVVDEMLGRQGSPK